MNAKAAANTTKAICSRCSGTRNCDIRGEYNERWETEHISGGTKWRILKCRGCDYVFVKTDSWDSENYDWNYDDAGDSFTTPRVSERYWPALSKRKLPEWLLVAVPADPGGKLTFALLELYEALEHDLHMLAAIGIRTAFDIAAGLLGIDSDISFEKKLEALVRSGGIGSVDKDRLGMLVEAGNASAHRGWRPTPSELDTMMDVLEHFVQEAWVTPARKTKLDEAAAKVKHTVPCRSPRKREKHSIGNTEG